MSHFEIEKKVICDGEYCAYNCIMHKLKLHFHHTVGLVTLSVDDKEITLSDKFLAELIKMAVGADELCVYGIYGLLTNRQD